MMVFAGYGRVTGLVLEGVKGVFDLWFDWYFIKPGVVFWAWLIGLGSYKGCGLKCWFGSWIGFGFVGIIY